MDLNKLRNKINIIGIGGKRRSGKDTTANVLIEEHGFNKLSFADPLKKVTAKTFGHDVNEYYDDNLKDQTYKKPLKITDEDLSALINNISYLFPVVHASFVSVMDLAGKEVNSHRELLQFIGSDIGRNRIDKEIWTTIFLDQVKKLGSVVVPDVRFKNERELIQSLGGTLLRIKRPSLQNNSKADNDISENSLGDDTEYNSVIINDGTIEDLRTKLINALNDNND